MVAASPAEIRLAYRHLYQGLLRAVNYSKPARYVVRDRLRAGFEEQSGNSFEPTRIANTLEFLNGAAKTRGLEHKILKNLVRVYWRESQNRLYTPPKDLLPLRRNAYKNFNRMLDKLNESMEMCLK
ncbi:uncharacterized protein MYCFIDRAFT_28278 [Pseudocercospora fijiensis CIRAD86]|uniref:DUF1763-domain-containing protein n=1 Tax=Pseudocercospora fijiensis (strain CIRAD86) TaxID=383855 RepID=N1Q9P7_PSEFD|nr:uncharacterized protein MYCFIDRAFT_28278 [Pseudocercospora fijiensis CIRAD86]EME87612.1 hypothetical protein MYCFIDRAFT_28278 [Pseudocercospora fijiensis CIRAD86]